MQNNPSGTYVVSHVHEEHGVITMLYGRGWKCHTTTAIELIGSGACKFVVEYPPGKQNRLQIVHPHKNKDYLRTASDSLSANNLGELPRLKSPPDVPWLGKPPDTPDRLLFLELLPERVSKANIKEILTDLELPCSGSWAQLFDQLEYALQRGWIDEENLLELWRNSADKLGFHIFLFETTDKKAMALMKKSQKLLGSTGSGQLFQRALATYRPSEPKLVDIRRKDDTNGEVLALLVEEERNYERLSGLERISGSLVRNIEIVSAPAVNKFCLHSDGLLELWLQSPPSWSYGFEFDETTKMMWNIAEGILPQNAFTRLGIIKTSLWKNRDSLRGGLIFVRMKLRNNYNNVMEVTSGRPRQCLTSNLDTCKSVDAFLGSSDNSTHSSIQAGYCEEANLWWAGIPTSFAGKINELSIGRGWHQDGYRDILDGISSCSRKPDLA